MNRQDYIFTQYKITDVEQAPEVLPDMHARILQYPKGKLSAQICCLQLPELRIYQNTVNQGLQIEMAPYFDGFSVVVLEHVSSTINWMGQDLETDNILLLPPGEVAQYSLPVSWSGIEFLIEKPLLIKLGLMSKDGVMSHD